MAVALKNPLSEQPVPEFRDDAPVQMLDAEQQARGMAAVREAFSRAKAEVRASVAEESRASAGWQDFPTGC